MKKLFLVAVASSLLFTACKKDVTEKNHRDTQHHTSELKTSVNEIVAPAMFKGTIPCADCDGIDVTINLKKGSTAIITNNYQKAGKNENTTYVGKYNINDNMLEVTYNSNTDKYLIVSNDKIMQVDANGKKADEKLADKYTLTRVVTH